VAGQNRFAVKFAAIDNGDIASSNFVRHRLVESRGSDNKIPVSLFPCTR
jgi:hypothetical protein